MRWETPGDEGAGRAEVIRDVTVALQGIERLWSSAGMPRGDRRWTCVVSRAVIRASQLPSSGAERCETCLKARMENVKGSNAPLKAHCNRPPPS